VRAKIGDGGMATVFLGRTSAPKPRSVAIKVIKAELSKHPDFIAMFMDEAKLVSQLSHPNLVEVIEVGSEGERLFIAMELLFGQSLWQVWDVCRERGVRLRYDMAAWIAARVADGLHHAHELNDRSGQPLMLVHRDVNASNIFVTYDGQVKVIDFGLAKAANRAHKTAAGIVKGKLAYLSPEQVGGQGIDRRSDVFALGTTLWELTTDRRLFRVADDTETLRRVHAAEVPDPTQLVEDYPPMLWQVLKRALTRDPAARYATAADFARSLDAFATTEGRAIEPKAVSLVMRELFAKELEQDAAWLEEARSPDGPPPTSTMHPPHSQTHPPPAEPSAPGVPHALLAPPRVPGGLSVPSREWPHGAPPDGMFSPASRPPQALAAAAGYTGGVPRARVAATVSMVAQSLPSVMMPPAHAGGSSPPHAPAPNAPPAQAPAQARTGASSPPNAPPAQAYPSAPPAQRAPPQAPPHAAPPQAPPPQQQQQATPAASGGGFAVIAIVLLVLLAVAGAVALVWLRAHH
jgi:serine/threonine-protein kinase